MQELNNDLYILLHNVITQLPSLFAMAICVVVAIFRWKQHPRVSLIVILALTFLILLTLVSAPVFIWVPGWLMSQDNHEGTQSVYDVMSVIYNVLLAVALSVLLLAVFIQRPQSQRS